MVMTISGLAALAAATWVTLVSGTVDVRTGLMFATAGLLVLNGALGFVRARGEAIAPAGGRGGAALLPRWSSITALHVVFVSAVLELGLNRLAVPMLRPFEGAPPAWHTALDYAGLFLFYFTGVLAAFVIAQRCVAAVRAERALRDPRQLAMYGFVALAGVLAVVPLVITAPAALSFVLELLFAAAVLAALISAFGKGRDLGVQIGLVLVAVPLLIHAVNVIGAQLLWPDNTFDGPGVEIARAGVTALCAAALLSPYCFAPRPFARAVTRPGPVVLAMTIAAVGAILARTFYFEVAQAAALAIGVEMTQGQADPRLALYLLAVATLVWTLASCAVADSPARRGVGLGLALVLLGGYGFRWPHHYLLPLLGLMLIADAVQRVRDEEVAALPLTSETPPIPDTTWATYIGAVTQALRRRLADVHSLTTRGEGGLMSSVIVGEADGLPVRTRIERIDGCVLALDVVIGRDIDEQRPATFLVSSIAPRVLGKSPPGPPASPAIRTGDAEFDERFRARGDAAILGAVLDDALRLRAVTTLDGWLACWAGEGVRYRVYPGRGAPIDHPMPLSDLALGRSATQAERLASVIELLVDIAARGVRPDLGPAVPALPRAAEEPG